MDLLNEDLGHLEGVRTALETCLGVEENEEVLTVIDNESWELGQSFTLVAASLGAEATLILMEPREAHGNEPPEAVASAMRSADVIIIPTSKSLSHTNAREEANENGARIASMPGIDVQIIKETLSADYEAIAERCEPMDKIISEGSSVNVFTEAGTDLTLNIKERDGISDTGILHDPGDFGNLPAGEVYCAPLENEGKGTLVIDTAMAGIGLLSEPIKIEFSEGKAKEIKGGRKADELRSILEDADDNAFKIAELGIGTNPEAKVSGNPLVDEKIMGTMHIALGNNLHMGGEQESEIHLDGIVSDPNFEVDGELVIENGEWKI